MRALYGSLMALSTLLFLLAIVVQVLTSVALLAGLLAAERGGQLLAFGMGLAVLAFVGFHGGQASRPR